MKVLLISDNPSQKTFHQIRKLTQNIRDMGHKVDLLALLEEGYQFNRKNVKESKTALDMLERVAKNDGYEAVAISLTKNNLERIFGEKNSAVELLGSITPQTHVFVFGALSILRNISDEEATRVHLCTRPGVDKLTREFRNTLIEYLRNHYIVREQSWYDNLSYG